MKEGISYIAKRQNKANNKYMKCYDSSKENRFIMYFDANNLYGWAISQYLPYSRFKWLNQKEIDRIDVNLIECNSIVVYILEVNLEYSDELCELHNDYPLAPEKLEISHNVVKILQQHFK